MREWVVKELRKQGVNLATHRVWLVKAETPEIALQLVKNDQGEWIKAADAWDVSPVEWHDSVVEM